MLKMTTKMVPKYIYFANTVIIWLEIYGKYYFIYVQTYKEFSSERLILLYKSYIFKMVHKKSPKYGFCCYCHGKTADILTIVHVFRYSHTNIRMISKRMVLHVRVFDKTFKILMMASMMANSDALSAIQTRKPAQPLSFQKVQHTNASPAAVCKVRELPMVEKLT